MNSEITDPEEISQVSHTGGQLKAFAMSTRTIHSSDDSVVSFSRSALESIVEQVAANDIWCVIEHLTFLPPVGRWVRAEIHESDDGEADLYLYGDTLSHYTATNVPDLDPIVASLPIGISPALSMSLKFDRQNFEPDVVQWIERDSNDLAHPVEQWSELPPLVFVLSIVVGWGAKRFLGSFLDELGRAAGISLASKLHHGRGEGKRVTEKLSLSLTLYVVMVPVCLVSL